MTAQHVDVSKASTACVLYVAGKYEVVNSANQGLHTKISESLLRFSIQRHTHKHPRGGLGFTQQESYQNTGVQVGRELPFVAGINP